MWKGMVAELRPEFHKGLVIYEIFLSDIPNKIRPSNRVLS